MSDPRQRLALAAHLWRLDQLERALGVLNDLGRAAFDRERAWLLRAAILRDLQRSDEAEHAALEGLAHFPGSVSLLTLLGDLLRQLDRLEEAEQRFLQALAIDPERVNALCGYALVVANAGQVEKAERLLARAAALAPDDVDVLGSRYLVASYANDDATSARLARELAEHTGGDPHSLLILGIEEAKRGRVDRSLDYVARAAEGDIRTVELVGPSYVRELRALRHPLMVGLWPVLRWGATPLYLMAIGGGILLYLLDLREWAGWFGGFWIAYGAYAVLGLALLRWRTR